MPNHFPNPFALPEKPPHRPLAASVKGLAILGGLLVAVLVLQSHTRHWLLQRWSVGLAELPVAEQMQRLLQIDQLGDLAIETVSRKVAAEDDRVAQAAVGLLRERQTQWTERDDRSLASAHMQMLIGLEAVIDDLPAGRLLPVSELLNQTVQDCRQRRSQTVSETFQVANHLLGRLAARRVTLGGSVTTDEIEQELLRRRTASADALASQSGGQATSSPSEAGTTVGGTVQAVDQPVAAIPSAVGRSGIAAQTVSTASSGDGVMKPAVATLRPEQTVHRVVSAGDSSDSTGDVVHGEYLRSIDQTPLRTFDTRTVIGMLGSSQTLTRDQAVEELVHRGLSNEEIRIANQLAASEVEVRLGLLESLGRRSDIDPRPWLLWLAEDSQREVRLRAVTALYAMNDPAVIAELRKRLSGEADPMVIAALRQVIDRR